MRGACRALCRVRHRPGSRQASCVAVGAPLPTTGHVRTIRGCPADANGGSPCDRGGSRRIGGPSRMQRATRKQGRVRAQPWLPNGPPSSLVSSPSGPRHIHMLPERWVPGGRFTVVSRTSRGRSPSDPRTFGGRARDSRRSFVPTSPPSPVPEVHVPCDTLWLLALLSGAPKGFGVKKRGILGRLATNDSIAQRTSYR